MASDFITFKQNKSFKQKYTENLRTVMSQPKSSRDKQEAHDDP